MHALVQMLFQEMFIKNRFIKAAGSERKKYKIVRKTEIKDNIFVLLQNRILYQSHPKKNDDVEMSQIYVILIFLRPATI